MENIPYPLTNAITPMETSLTETETDKYGDTMTQEERPDAAIFETSPLFSVYTSVNEMKHRHQGVGRLTLLRKDDSSKAIISLSNTVPA